jgi:hypothetical protein
MFCTHTQFHMHSPDYSLDCRLKNTLTWDHIVVLKSHRKSCEQKVACVSKDQDCVLNAAFVVFTFKVLMPGILFCRLLEILSNWIVSACYRLWTVENHDAQVSSTSVLMVLCSVFQWNGWVAVHIECWCNNPTSVQYSLEVGYEPTVHTRKWEFCITNIALHFI